ncbi:DUF551 domain-containing protein [Klebsiella quasipneumoniae]|uniref:DUF551 domain-containing protein n=1 Tax=Klebsiella quasipneumoniae TaxID=1463165 RepID=UPI001EFB9871|nr:DUF551 domain-containing protein [Klebsiella quasipneumoniae]
MTKSTITRERSQQIFLGNGPEPSASEERELARMALTAMDSSESVELPLDYLQGQKDGLEWAAQLAEANHPETGDWLYDDPIELAKAIRKGPDMPPVQPVADSEPVAWTWQHLKQWYVTNDEERARELAWDGVKVEQLYRHAQPAPVVQCPFPCGWENLNKLAIQDAAFVARGLVEGEPTTEAQRQAAISNNYRLLKVISACRAAMLAADPHDTPALNPVQSVVTVPGKWIPVREQMPESKPGSYEYLVFETLNNRVNHDYWNAPDKGDDAFTPFWNYYGEHVTHWMPLPAAPQEVNRE